MIFWFFGRIIILSNDGEEGENVCFNGVMQNFIGKVLSQRRCKPSSAIYAAEFEMSLFYDQHHRFRLSGCSISDTFSVSVVARFFNFLGVSKV